MKKYNVTENGVVINTKTDRVLKQRIRKDGYVDIKLCDKGKSIRKMVHVLVAQKYIPNPLGLPEVNHKDLNKQNNSVSNLEWTNRKGNINHAFNNNAMPIGIERFSNKLTENQVLEIRSKYIPRLYHAYMLAKEYNVSVPTIYAIIKRKKWKHI